jgi:acyl-CoA thioester hydrolase
MEKYVRSIRITVPFSDVDMMGHVNNVRYFTYFETVRAEHLHNLTKGKDAPGLGLILVRAEIDYKSPAKWLDVLLVKMRTIAVGNSSWVYEYEIVDETSDRVIATGKTVQVAYDYGTSTSIAIPEKMKEKLLKEIEDTKD